MLMTTDDQSATWKNIRRTPNVSARAEGDSTSTVRMGGLIGRHPNARASLAFSRRLATRSGVLLFFGVNPETQKEVRHGSCLHREESVRHSERVARHASHC